METTVAIRALFHPGNGLLVSLARAMAISATAGRVRISLGHSRTGVALGLRAVTKLAFRPKACHLNGIPKSAFVTRRTGKASRATS